MLWLAGLMGMMAVGAVTFFETESQRRCRRHESSKLSGHPKTTFFPAPMETTIYWAAKVTTK